MKMSLKSTLLATSMLALAPSAALAVPFTDNGTPVALPAGGASTLNAGTDVLSFDDFVLSADSILTDITWFGSTTDENDDGSPFGPAPDNGFFTISIYADDGGFPALVPIETYNVDSGFGAVGTGLIADGEEIFEYSASVGGIATLNAGATYWISIQNDLGGSAPGTEDDQWVWAASDAPGSYVFSDGVSDTVQGDNNLAFTLDGEVVAVSEPGMLGLFGAALAGLALRRRRA